VDETTYRLLAPHVTWAAKKTAWDWVGVLDAEDAEQMIWDRLLSAGDQTVNKLAGMDVSLLKTSLREIGKQIAAEERDDYHRFSGNFRYGTKEVRRYLEGGVLFNSQDPAMSMFDRPEILARGGMNVSFETATVAADTLIGFKRLQKKNAPYAHLIGRVFVAFEKLNPSERKTLSRAIVALTREMNGASRTRNSDFSNGPGARNLVSRCLEEV